MLSEKDHRAEMANQGQPKYANHSAIADNGLAVAQATADIVNAQLSILQLMSQCTVAWMTLPVTLAQAAIEAPAGALKSVAPGSIDESAPSYSASSQAAHSPSWLAAPPIVPMMAPVIPVIDGIEETLHAQFFESRPRKVQERDVLKLDVPTLWKRSNEFEPGHFEVKSARHSSHLSDQHRAA